MTIDMIDDSPVSGSFNMLYKAKVTKPRLASRWLSGETITNTVKVARVTFHKNKQFSEDNRETKKSNTTNKENFYFTAPTFISGRKLYLFNLFYFIF